ncbi:hypothetical protein AB6A40_004632 [Gnathostoma spinigerum]|uniref:Palmitoyltransferase n=1 Tax=Gnathostoma spinigerum TaxID=75299 RepID=A0ABD6ELT4_9BILA
MSTPYCFTCGVVKPQRACHCKTCGRCVLRRDHHCPVLGECIHFHNHKYFVLFLFWAEMLCIFTLLTVLPDVIRQLNFNGKPFFPIEKSISMSFVISGVATALICGVSLGIFLSEQVRALLRNQTTMERVKRVSYGSKGPYGDGLMTYDLGSKRRNFESIFGPNPWLWPFPVHSAVGDGYSFEYSLEVPVVKTSECCCCA